MFLDKNELWYLQDLVERYDIEVLKERDFYNMLETIDALSNTINKTNRID